MPVRWLRDYVDIAVPLEELARLLTMAGIETEIANDKADAWRHMWVGRITALERVPQSKHLHLATVDYGHGVRQVVTGASNLKEGQVVPYAEVGASYIDGKTGERATLKPTKLLGVRSEGMVMSEKELGLGEDHEGILILNGQHEVGEPLAEALGESVFVCELQPNRADCLGVLGLAREVAAILGADVREPAHARRRRANPRSLRARDRGRIARGRDRRRHRRREHRDRRGHARRRARGREVRESRRRPDGDAAEPVDRRGQAVL